MTVTNYGRLFCIHLHSLLCFLGSCVLLSRLCGHYNRVFFETFGSEKWERCVHVIRITTPLASQMALPSRHRLSMSYWFMCILLCLILLCRMSFISCCARLLSVFSSGVWCFAVGTATESSWRSPTFSICQYQKLTNLRLSKIC